MSLRLRLSLAFIFVVLVPLLLAGLLIGPGVPGIGADAARHRVASSAAAIAAELSATCSVAEAEAAAVANQAGGAAAVAGALTHGVTYAAVVDPTGHLVRASGTLPSAAQAAVDRAGSLQPLRSCSDDVAPGPSLVGRRSPRPVAASSRWSRSAQARSRRGGSWPMVT